MDTPAFKENEMSYEDVLDVTGATERAPSGDHIGIRPMEARPTPELQAEALYGPIGEWVNLMRPHTEASPAALLFCDHGYWCARRPGPSHQTGRRPSWCESLHDARGPNIER